MAHAHPRTYSETCHIRIYTVLFSLAGMVIECPMHISLFPYDKQLSRFSFGSRIYDASLVQFQIGEETMHSKATRRKDGGEFWLETEQVNITATKYSCCAKPFSSISYLITIDR